MKTPSFATCREAGWFSFIFLAVVLLCCGVLAACSGGSGGSGGGGSTPTVTYSGATTPAAISADNSGTLVSNSFQGALVSDSMVPFGAMDAGSADGDDGGSPLTVMTLQGALAESLDQAVAGSRSSYSASFEPNEVSTNPLTGECGGTAAYSASYNQSSGVYSGQLRFNGYCTGGVTLSGEATVVFRLDQTGDTFDFFRFTFSHLTMAANGESLTIAGTLECEVQGGDLFIMVDMVQGNATSGQICWLDDYTIQLSGDQMFVSGRFYDPIEGYIDFETIEALEISGSSPYPSAGVIVFTGATGDSGQPTSARLEAVSVTECQVTGDFDGDGIYEYNSGVMLWAEL